MTQRPNEEGKASLERIEKANELQNQIDAKRRDIVSLARDCEKLLLEEQKYHRHGEWQEWVRGHFYAGYETAHDYITIAENWDDDLEKAVADGLCRNTKRGVLEYIRQRKREARPTTPDVELTEGQKLRRDCERDIARTLRSLVKNEMMHVEVSALVTLLHSRGGCVIWDAFRAILQNAICEVLGYDPKEHGDREAYLKALPAVWDGKEHNDKLESHVREYLEHFTETRTDTEEQEGRLFKPKPEPTAHHVGRFAGAGYSGRRGTNLRRTG